MADCEHFEICGLAGSLSKIVQGRGLLYYCQLHNPQSGKDRGLFKRSLDYYLGQGKSDFRKMVFVAGVSLSGHNFSQRPNFSEAVFAGGVFDLEGATFKDGLILNHADFITLQLKNAEIRGLLSIAAEKTVAGIGLEHAKILGFVNITAPSVGWLNASSSKVSGQIEITMDGSGESEINFAGASLYSDFNLKVGHAKGIFLSGARCSRKVSIIARHISEIRCHGAQFEGDLEVQADSVASLSLDNARCESKLVIKGVFGSCSLASAHINGVVDFRNSEVTAPCRLFETAQFTSTAELYLDSTKLSGDVVLKGNPTPPKSISINGTTINGDFIVRSPLEHPPVEILAIDSPPQINGQTRFTNVDVARLRFLGNSFQNIELSKVKWATRYWRNVVFDEIVMRERNINTWIELEEAYQILKEKYRQLGDHVTFGDFHYGEMESKRREGGWRKRLSLPEVIYWALSGYGIGYIRAFLFLLVFILIPAAFYHLWGGELLESNFGKSLLFSFRTAILARPELPDSFTTVGRWINAFESVVVPVQAALFILALRMRLKR